LLAPRGQKWPAGQTSQEVEPKGFAKVPAAQGEHDEALNAALNEPGGHKIQLREVKLA